MEAPPEMRTSSWSWSGVVANNLSNQMNPNDPAYKSSREFFGASAVSTVAVTLDSIAIELRKTRSAPHWTQMPAIPANNAM